MAWSLRWLYVSSKLIFATCAIEIVLQPEYKHSTCRKRVEEGDILTYTGYVSKMYGSSLKHIDIFVVQLQRRETNYFKFPAIDGCHPNQKDEYCYCTRFSLEGFNFTISFGVEIKDSLGKLRVAFQDTKYLSQEIVLPSVHDHDPGVSVTVDGDLLDLGPDCYFLVKVNQSQLYTFCALNVESPILNITFEDDTVAGTHGGPLCLTVSHTVNESHLFYFQTFKYVDSCGNSKSHACLPAAFPSNPCSELKSSQQEESGSGGELPDENSSALDMERSDPIGADTQRVKTDNMCIFPEEIRGTWYATGKGKVHFSKSLIRGLSPCKWRRQTCHGEVQTRWQCSEKYGSGYYIRSSVWKELGGLYRAHACLYFSRKSSTKFNFYMLPHTLENYPYLDFVMVRKVLYEPRVPAICDLEPGTNLPLGRRATLIYDSPESFRKAMLLCDIQRGHYQLETRSGLCKSKMDACNGKQLSVQTNICLPLRFFPDQSAGYNLFYCVDSFRHDWMDYIVFFNPNKMFHKEYNTQFICMAIHNHRGIYYAKYSSSCDLVSKPTKNDYDFKITRNYSRGCLQ